MNKIDTTANQIKTNANPRNQKNQKNQKNQRRVLIAGGSGMIGKEVCLEFLKKGYDVYCLSRSLNTLIKLDGVKIRRIDEDWSDLIDKHTIIINLSGANPGAKRWTSSVKSEIAASRFRVIEIIVHNIERAHEKPLKYLQASAAGFYGDASDSLLTERSKAVPGKNKGTKFRVAVCQEIENRSQKANCKVVNLRIGHVLSNTGGILPYFRFAAFFGIGRFASGNQFVPFVHIHDVAKAIEFISDHNDIVDGVINIAAPEPCKNSQFLKELRPFKWVPGFALSQTILKLLIGQSSVVLTDSERVYPKRLLEKGFKFNYKTIREALNGLQ